MPEVAIVSVRREAEHGVNVQSGSGKAFPLLPVLP